MVLVRPSGDLPLLDDISLHVPAGRTAALVGASGAGKSMTAYAVLRLFPVPARITGGRILFSGLDLAALPERDLVGIRGRHIGMIFQEPGTALDPVMSVGDQVVEGIVAHHGRGGSRDRAIEVLGRVGLDASFMRRYPHMLSGGQRQRVLIASAIGPGPDLLIADEPTAALDVTVQAQILDLLARLQRDLGMSLLLITHDLGIVARVATRVAIMYAGQIVETGTVDEIFTQPMHPYTQGLLRCIPVPGKTRRGERLGSIPGLVPNLIGELAGCSFRNRCAHAFADCAGADVGLQELAPGRAYRCLLSPGQCAENALAAAE